MKIGVVGDGVFGTFLKKEFHKTIPDKFDLDYTNADVIILAVPSSAYDQVAQTHHDKHLVNVCSTQAKTNYVCSKWSDRVTGIHPLFGPRTTPTARNAIVTKTCDEPFALESVFVIEVFEAIMGGNVVTYIPEGDGWHHDEIMASTHVEVVKLQHAIQTIIKNAQHFPDDVCPNSFIKLRAFADTFGDMPDGTLSSILDNPMIEHRFDYKYEYH